MTAFLPPTTLVVIWAIGCLNFFFFVDLDDHEWEEIMGTMVGSFCFFYGMAWSLWMWGFIGLIAIPAWLFFVYFFASSMWRTSFMLLCWGIYAWW